MRVANEVTSSSNEMTCPAIPKGYGSRDDNEAEPGERRQRTASHLAAEQPGQLLHTGKRYRHNDRVSTFVPAGFLGNEKAELTSIPDHTEAGAKTVEFAAQRRPQPGCRSGTHGDDQSRFSPA